METESINEAFNCLHGLKFILWSKNLLKLSVQPDDSHSI